MSQTSRRCRPLRRARAARSARASAFLTLTALGLALWPRPVSSQKGACEGAYQPQFKYAGGTEEIPPGCSGTLQLGTDSMTYSCTPHTAVVPYRAIETMQYRADVVRRVRKLKVKWRLVPPFGGGHVNRYFTLVYRVSSATHVLILEVPNDEMRPYLAEIDLKCGRRVDVERHEDYQ